MRRPSSAARARACCSRTAATMLDMSSLAECSNLGHQHPRLVRGDPRRRPRSCASSRTPGAPSRAPSSRERLLEKSGFDGGRVFFTLGGADANEHAVKFARQARGKPRGVVIARDRSYHGATLRSRWRCPATRARASQVDPDAFGVSHVPPPYAYRCPFGSRDADRVRRARGRRGRRDASTQLGARPRRGGDHGAERRHQRHRRARQLLAGACASDTRARGVYADRRRGHERLRPLRRVVRLAAPRRSRPRPT